MTDKKKIEPRKVFYINREKTISLFDMIIWTVFIVLASVGITILSVHDSYMFQESVKMPDGWYNIGITVPVDSLGNHKRLYPSVVIASTGKAIIVLTERKDAKIIYQDEVKK